MIYLLYLFLFVFTSIRFKYIITDTYSFSPFDYDFKKREGIQKKDSRAENKVIKTASREQLSSLLKKNDLFLKIQVLLTLLTHFLKISPLINFEQLIPFRSNFYHKYSSESSLQKKGIGRNLFSVPISEPFKF
jgi:hypothetical protein